MTTLYDLLISANIEDFINLTRNLHINFIKISNDDICEGEIVEYEGSTYCVKYADCSSLEKLLNQIEQLGNDIINGLTINYIKSTNESQLEKSDRLKRLKKRFEDIKNKYKTQSYSDLWNLKYGVKRPTTVKYKNPSIITEAIPKNTLQKPINSIISQCEQIVASFQHLIELVEVTDPGKGYPKPPENKSEYNASSEEPLQYFKTVFNFQGFKKFLLGYAEIFDGVFWWDYYNDFIETADDGFFQRNSIPTIQETLATLENPKDVIAADAIKIFEKFKNEPFSIPDWKDGETVYRTESLGNGLWREFTSKAMEAAATIDQYIKDAPSTDRADHFLRIIKIDLQRIREKIGVTPLLNIFPVTANIIDRLEKGVSERLLALTGHSPALENPKLEENNSKQQPAAAVPLNTFKWENKSISVADFAELCLEKGIFPSDKTDKKSIMQAFSGIPLKDFSCPPIQILGSRNHPGHLALITILLDLMSKGYIQDESSEKTGKIVKRCFIDVKGETIENFAQAFSSAIKNKRVLQNKEIRKKYNNLLDALANS